MMNWGYKKEETCISARGIFFGFEKTEFYKSLNKKIISTQEFYDIEKVSKKTREEANEYFEKVKPNRWSKG